VVGVEDWGGKRAFAASPRCEGPCGAGGGWLPRSPPLPCPAWGLAPVG